MNSLHLFAGLGGGILADKILGHRIVGAVEIEPYCRAVLKQRQEEGWLEPFPIFEDVRTFNATEINERIDLVCGGFPCQNISSAGRGEGIDGSKSSLFYELIRICRNIRPDYIFLENSPLIASRGLDTVLREIAEIGYNAEWGTLSAGAIGAPHKRDRWWCLCQRAGSDGGRELQPERRVEEIGRRLRDLGKETYKYPPRRSYNNNPTGEGRDTANADNVVRDAQTRTDGPSKRQSAISDTRGVLGSYEETRRADEGSCDDTADDGGREGPDPESVRQEVIADSWATEQRKPELGGARSVYGREPAGWWETEPDMGRVVNGLPNRVDRIKGLGNAQVPACAALAFFLLMRRFCDDV